jgi:DNA N-6-adenine-methyltransferase (Dam)
MTGIYLGKNANTTTVEWYTPSYIFDALGCVFDLDPASPGREVVPWIPAKRCYTREDDGLSQPWRGSVWLNCPYGKHILPLWVERFVDHANGVMLVPERTSTRWWQHLTSYADLVLFVNKKIAFISPSRCRSSAQPIGSCLVATGDHGVAALENANRNGLGRLVRPIVYEGA